MSISARVLALFIAWAPALLVVMEVLRRYLVHTSTLLCRMPWLLRAAKRGDATIRLSTLTRLHR